MITYVYVSMTIFFSLQEILIKITEYLEELKFETEDLYEEVDITPGTEAVER